MNCGQIIIPKKQYCFCQTRVDNAADEIVETIKNRMLTLARKGYVYERSNGPFGKKERYIAVRIRVRVADYFQNTPHVHVYDGEPMPDVWQVHDKSEFQALFHSLKSKCAAIGITVEITKSAALHDDSPEYLFTSLC